MPQLILRKRTESDDYELFARAWQAANDKARELGGLRSAYSALPSAPPTPNRRAHQHNGDDHQYWCLCPLSAPAEQ
jgi:hypothetical protein